MASNVDREKGVYIAKECLEIHKTLIGREANAKVREVRADPLQVMDVVVWGSNNDVRSLCTTSINVNAIKLHYL